MTGKLAWGSAVALLSALFYACYGAAAKMLAQLGILPFQTAFFSFAVGLICLLPVAVAKGIGHLKTEAFPMHVLRALFGMAFLVAVVIALKTVPLVDAVMLNNTAPLFVSIIARFWLGCKQSRWTWAALALGLFGVGFVLKPDASIVQSGSWLALLSGVLMAFSWTSVRKLSMTEPVFRIVFYYFLLAAAFSGAACLFFPFSTSSGALWLLLIAGLFFGASVWLLTYSATLMPIVVVSILYYSVILFSGVLNWAFWNQTPDFWTYVGMALIVLGGVFSILVERHRKKKECI